ELLARWDDEGAHRAYLDDAAARGLEGLGEAGRRYREVLAARPGDAAAARSRDEVLRRALAQGLAQLPRAATPAASRARLTRGLAFGLGLVVTLGAAWAALRLFGTGAF
ncbi:MAG TPA: hypothetical protein VD838_03100, partial [Anaeromyxobacteraceae bacterium]|nr:hypothetical protein [Anaeromyxobacteraceae bacterium]